MLNSLNELFPILVLYQIFIFVVVFVRDFELPEVLKLRILIVLRLNVHQFLVNLVDLVLNIDSLFLIEFYLKRNRHLETNSAREQDCRQLFPEKLSDQSIEYTG